MATDFLVEYMQFILIWSYFLPTDYMLLFDLGGQVARYIHLCQQVAGGTTPRRAPEPRYKELYPLGCSLPERLIAGQQPSPGNQSVVKYQTCLI